MSSTSSGYTSQTMTQSELATEQTAQLISSDMVDGASIYDAAGTNIGSVQNMMINKVSGQVAYVVASLGGFLGIGSEYHPFPWKALTYDTSLGGYRVNLSREALEKAPRYSMDKMPWTDPAYGPSVSAYYGYPV